jgi:putative membrane protein
MAGGGLLLPACALIIFSDSPMYAPFQEGSTLVPILTPLHDQQLGGVLMKITQEISYSIALAYTFFRWVGNERAKERRAREELSAVSTFSGSVSGKPQTNLQ